MREGRQTRIVLIGKGRIAAPLADWITASPDHELLGRTGRDQPPPFEAGALTIDCAGPAALREHGANALRHGDLWSIGAAALASTAFLGELRAIADDTGHRLRLFTGWIGTVRLIPDGMKATLSIEQAGPGLAATPGVLFDGPLAEAATLYPDHLNTACAAALTGPGIAATRLKLVSTPAGGGHYIRSVLETPAGRLESSVDLAAASDCIHPVSAAIIAALEARNHWLEY